MVLTHSSEWTGKNFYPFCSKASGTLIPCENAPVATASMYFWTTSVSEHLPFSHDTRARDFSQKGE